MYTRHDYLRRLADELAARHISRRVFLRRAAILGLSTPMLSAILAACGERTTTTPGATDDDEDAAAVDTADDSDGVDEEDEEPRLVVSSWGGNFGEGQRIAQFEPFTAETGIEIVLSPQQPEISLLEAQVTSGNVEWDLANNSHLGAYTLAGKGMLEPIDYSRMDPDIVNGLDEHIRGEYSVGIYYWSSILGYSLDWFTEDEHPVDWADYWDIERFPGPRGLTSMDFEPPPLEIPLLANGVSPSDLYPIDIEEAFGYLDDFRDSITAWTGYGVDGTQLLVQGELAATPGGNGGLTNAIADGANIGMSWNQGLLYYDAWVIPKGAPRQGNAHRFIEFCSRPDIQAAFVREYPIGAVTPAAHEFVPEDVAEVALSNPDHMAVQVATDTEWWTEVNEDGKTNLELVYEKWAEWIL
jgi:putative spermidine/putrescine transport system substrate-binding protein